MRIWVRSDTDALLCTFSASTFTDGWTLENWLVSPTAKTATLPTYCSSADGTRRREDLRKFWTSVYRRGSTPEATNLAPFEVVTPFIQGTIQQMSYIFACLCGLASLFCPNSKMTRFEYQPGDARLNVKWELGRLSMQILLSVRFAAAQPSLCLALHTHVRRRPHRAHHQPLHALVMP